MSNTTKLNFEKVTRVQFDPIKFHVDSEDSQLYPIANAREEGLLKVSEKHTLFYAVYGNPDGIPVIILHGGPGGGCSDKICQFFDLNQWNVVMFDQRGAMRSKPFACMDENTTQYSIQDIELLRKHLGIEQWIVFGGSWGSSLALLYGQEHYERCIGFILRGICLAREQDYLHLLYGMGKIFPEAYERVVNHIPKEECHDLLSAYYRRVFNPNPEVHLAAARQFMRFDFVCSTYLPNAEYVEEIMQNDMLILSIAKAFFHYAHNRFFIEENQILSRMEKIAHLPAILIHGRWDAICLVEMAHELHKNWPNSALWIIPEGGHTIHEPAIAKALTTATNNFVKKLNWDKNE